MQVQWLIEDSERLGSLDELFKEILDSGSLLHKVKVNYADSSSIVQLDDFDRKKPLITYATIPFIGWLRKNSGRKETCFFPFYYADRHRYDVSRYVHILKDEYINKNYRIMPLRDLPNKGNPFGDKPVFIRPVDGYKLFAGYVINKGDRFSSFEHEISDIIKNTMWAEDVLVLISEAVDIIEEYRFIVADNKVVTGSTYIRNKEDDDHQEVEVVMDGPLYDYASRIAKLFNSGDQFWQPEPVYTLDIAKTESGYKTIEINSFSCAGLYACNKKVVVNEVNKAVLKDWQDNFGY